MLFPPDRFHPVSPRQYLWQLGVGPALCALVVSGAQVALIVLLSLGAIGVMIGGAAAWVSVFGSRHAIVAALLVWLFFYLPLAIAPTLLVASAGGSIRTALAVAGAQVIVLAGTAAWFLRRSPRPSADRGQVDWPGARIDPARRLILPRDAPVTASAGAGSVAAALASVPLYHALGPTIGTDAGLAALALAVNLLFVALVAATVARPLAQGLRLLLIERRTGRFTTGRLPELESLRQRYAFGRWLRRRMPLGPRGPRGPLGR